jgi:putative glycerol-1-phosphate prenyltransferase
MTSYEKLTEIKRRRGAGYIVLIDPDKTDPTNHPRFVEQATEAGVDAFFIGGSLMVKDQFETIVRITKDSTPLPVIIFPGSLSQISSIADAILFLVLVSGRNPDHLIGNQVTAAPLIKASGLEAISTAYMLVDGGSMTSAEFMSNTKPLPKNKPDIAVAHALAAEYIGMKLLYFDAGSGADMPVSTPMIESVSRHCSLPIIVGGGIRTPEAANMLARAGASFIVTGNIMEEKPDASLLRDFANAIHATSSVKK